MTYIENIFICLTIPLVLSVFFVRGRTRNFTIFVMIGMGICLLSAYVSSFFMGYYGTDAALTAIEITPVCEEVMKLLPLLFYFFIFEPKQEELPTDAIAIAVGFATLEQQISHSYLSGEFLLVHCTFCAEFSWGLASLMCFADAGSCSLVRWDYLVPVPDSMQFTISLSQQKEDGKPPGIFSLLA